MLRDFRSGGQSGTTTSRHGTSILGRSESHTIKPRTNTIGRADIPGPASQNQKDRLTGIVCIVIVTGDSSADTQHSWTVTVNQCGEGVGIPAIAKGNQELAVASGIVRPGQGRPHASNSGGNSSHEQVSEADTASARQVLGSCRSARRRIFATSRVLSFPILTRPGIAPQGLSGVSIAEVSFSDTLEE